MGEGSIYKSLILGSNSPRRHEIMEMAGYVFSVMVSYEDEIADPAMDVFDIPEELARQKSAHILPQIEIEGDDFILLTADTVVILEGEIIGKPSDKDDARRILSSLSGKTHIVVSAVCLGNRHFQESFSDHTKVHFGQLSDEEINHYIEHFEVMDKAGAYAIQEGIGLTGIDSIEGSYYNVMGLPIHKVYRALSRLKVYPRDHR